jgi:hypothetical protein
MRRLAEAEAGLRRADAALKAAPRLPVAATPTGDDPGPNPRIAAQRRALGAIRSQIAALRGRSAPRADIPRGAPAVVAIDTEWTLLMREVSEARERQDKLESKQFQAQLAATLASGGHASRFVIADARSGRCVLWPAVSSRSSCSAASVRCAARGACSGGGGLAR